MLHLFYFQGSGKTLAFGIPLIHKILNFKKQPHNVVVLEQNSHIDDGGDGKEGEDDSDIGAIYDSDVGSDNEEEEDVVGEKVAEGDNDEEDGSDLDLPPEEEDCYYVQVS